MLTHYIDFDVIEGAMQSDIQRLHGRILSTSHIESLGINVFDFIHWKATYAGTVLRMFATESKLESLLGLLDALTSVGAVTHSGIHPIPPSATLSDYTYTRQQAQTSHSASAKRRFLKRNPDKVWVAPSPEQAKPATGYRVIMFSHSTGSVYPLYIKRSPYDAAKENSRLFNFRIPTFAITREAGRL